MLERQVDGLLLATARRRDAVIEELLTASVPFVLVNRTIDRGGVAAVIPDDQAGMALAVDHLHDLGHRVIGHIAGPSATSTGARRAAGFEAAVRSMGLEPGPTVEVSSFTVEGGRAVAAGLLTGSRRPSALVAANDLIALGALDVADDLGLSCPGDFSLVGFNDMPFVDRLRPPLTTIRVDEYELGLRASRMLLSLIEDPEARRETIMLTPSSSCEVRPRPLFELVGTVPEPFDSREASYLESCKRLQWLGTEWLGQGRADTVNRKGTSMGQGRVRTTLAALAVGLIVAGCSSGGGGGDRRRPDPHRANRS